MPKKVAIKNVLLLALHIAAINCQLCFMCGGEGCLCPFGVALLELEPRLRNRFSQLLAHSKVQKRLVIWRTNKRVSKFLLIFGQIFFPSGSAIRFSLQVLFSGILYNTKWLIGFVRALSGVFRRMRGIIICFIWPQNHLQKQPLLYFAAQHLSHFEPFPQLNFL